MANVEDYGTVTFENGKAVPLDPGASFDFPEPVEIDISGGTPAPAKSMEPEIDIEIVDDTPERDRGRKPMATPPEPVTDDELSTYDEKVQKRIKKLGKGYHDERRAKEEAFRMRDEAIRAAKVLADELKRTNTQLHDGSKLFIEQGKQSAETEMSMAKKAYKEAYDAGDGDALAEAQQKMSEATLRLDKARNMQPIVAREVPVPENTPATKPQDPKLASWMEANPWFRGDDPEEEDMTALAYSVHNRLVREFGAQYAGTDEYYTKVTGAVQRSFPDKFGSQQSYTDTPPAREEPQRRARPAASVVAPATRSTAPRKVQLTPTQVQIAKRLGVPLELYAKQVAAQMNGERA